MTAATRDLLETIDRLSEAERLELAVELLRRISPGERLPLDDDILSLAAEATFLELDAREPDDSHAKS
jgi:hypothetical protein